MDWAKTIAKRDKKYLRFGIWFALYQRFNSIGEFYRIWMRNFDIYIPNHEGYHETRIRMYVYSHSHAKHQE